ncbi:MAG: baseplate J family protein [Clostridia bacterium BRH_c25]|nr:MAG: baseplate J family protein [Clostridia bacterium BRH_c25]
MYENQTAEEIRKRVLDRVSSDYDKREGGVIYDCIEPSVLELEQVYIALDSTIEKMDIEVLSGDELAQRIYQRTGMTRKPATYAAKQLEATGTGSINEGDLFQTGSGIQFKAMENVLINGSGTVRIQAAVAGAEGNVPANTIKYMPVSIPGIDSVTNQEPTEGGYDAESDEDLLQRYYERIKTPPTSGNKSQYKMWAKEVTGVGDARVVPLWNGNNTVKVVLIDANKEPANAEVVSSVQNYIDPEAAGEGKGAAPVGAYCTVVSADGKTINVAFTALDIDPAYTEEQRKANVEAKLGEYFRSITFREDITEISYAQIGYRLLDATGIRDYSDLTINGGTANIPLVNNEVPVLGVVTIA